MNVASLATLFFALFQSTAPTQTSGRALPPEQAAYDVVHYDLSLRVDPATRSIEGVLAMRARALDELSEVVFDLDARLAVRSVRAAGADLEHSFDDGVLRVRHPQAPGDEFTVAVAYGGVPREAPNPPWDGGFTWAQTADGSPWIATSCQGEGADLWWPCKDQPSDEPESMDLRITVPNPLVVASNGRLLSVTPAEAGWTTHHWHVSTPINNYGVALNIAPYATLSEIYTSTAGDAFPIVFWVLPENLEQGRELFGEFALHLRFFEEIFGPYPFRADKYGVAETPHLGMEHQSIIAYGNMYRGNPWGPQRGFDFLHHHEASHEWWANLVTARNWNDYWIHESFGTYAQALYVEKLHGDAAYLEQMIHDARRILNVGAIAPREPYSTKEMFHHTRADAPDHDVYFKGSWVLHTLRWAVGDDAKFFRALRRMAYPDPALESTTDGSACRFETTDGILAIAEEHTGLELDGFFEVYLRQPKLPRLHRERRGDELLLEWELPVDVVFEVAVPVRVGTELRRIPMPGGRATVAVPRGVDVAIDPDQRLLLERETGPR